MILIVAKFSLFLLYVLLSSSGLYHMKAADTLLSVKFISGFAAYVLGFLLWVYILRILPLSMAFPVAAGSLILATSMIGYFFLHESMPFVKIIGLILIFSGIVLVYSYQELQ